MDKPLPLQSTALPTELSKEPRLESLHLTFYAIKILRHPSPDVQPVLLESCFGSAQKTSSKIHPLQRISKPGDLCTKYTYSIKVILQLTEGKLVPAIA